MSTTTAVSPPRSRSRDGRWALLAVGTVFATSGAMMGANLPRLPLLRDQVDATLSELGLALVFVGVGSVVAMPWTGWLVKRLGTRAVVLGATVLTAVAWVAVGASQSVPAMAAALFFTGAGFGTWDVGMNVAGYDVEQRDKRSWMPRLHAAFSGGAILGAAVSALSLRLDVPTFAHLLAVSVVMTVLVAGCVRAFLPSTPSAAPSVAQGTTEGVRPAGGRRFWWFQAPVLLLAVVIAGTAFGEGAANDWLSIFFVDERGTSAAFGAVAYAGFNGAMFVGRLVGGGAIDRWGRAPVLRVCGLLAAVGVTLLCLAPWTAAAVVGTLLWGLGLSVVFPGVMSAAGEAVPGRGPETIAVVATMGYGGFLLGPPLLGLVAEHAGLERSLLVVAGLAVLIAVLAGATRERPAPPTGSAAEPALATP